MDEEGWRYSTDTGWNDWDIHIYGNFWWSIALRTVTEYHGGPKCLTRVSLRTRFVATTVIINLAILTLLIYHQLSTGQADLWVMLGYMGFLLFLATRGRKLKSRVAELVDLAAYRTGLQRLNASGVVSESSVAPPLAAPEVR